MSGTLGAITLSCLLIVIDWLRLHVIYVTRNTRFTSDRLKAGTYTSPLIAKGLSDIGLRVIAVVLNLPFEMLPDAILTDVFRQISNPQVTCLSNHFAPNSSFGTGCCGIVWRHCTTTHNDLDRWISNHRTLHQHTRHANYSFGQLSSKPLVRALLFLLSVLSLSLSLSLGTRPSTLLRHLLFLLYLRLDRNEL